MPIQRIQHRRGTSAEWAAADPVLASAEWGYDTTLKNVKIGDGATAWNALSWYSETSEEVITYQGAWDPATNTPTLADGTGALGDYYQASADGTIDLGTGLIAFVEGDYVEYDGTVWSRVPNTFLVNAVEAAETGLRLVRGTIDTSGSGTILEGGGFSITRNGVGDLTVTFTTAFADLPSVVLTPLGAGSSVGPIASHKNGFTRTTSAFRVEVVSIGSGFADGTFDFVAVGPQ